MDAAAETRRRKEEHLRIPLERDVQSMPSPWPAIRLRHEALPDFDAADVDLATSLLGHDLAAPILLTGMTGGTPAATRINADLAAAAAKHRVAMGVGSQRAAIEDPALADSYQVILEHEVPVRLANLGLPQLILWGDAAAGHAETALEMIDGHGLAIHLNYLQEVCQPEGDTVAAGGLDAIRRLVADIKAPIIVKETGAGIDAATATRLADAGVAGIDVGGLGGTSFSAVEHHRAVDQDDHAKARLGQTYWDWGTPTPDAIRGVRAACPDLPIIATGGLTTGLDAAKALAIGADIAGYAGQVFRAAAAGRATEEVALLRDELATACFLTGCREARGLGAAQVVSG